MFGSISEINNRYTFSKLMTEYGVMEVYISDAHLFMRDGMDILVVPETDRHKDMSGDIFMRMVDLYCIKLSMQMKDHVAAQGNRRYCLLWKNGEWYA